MQNCIYRFINKIGEVIYIGKATYLKNRIRSHSHLPEECYKERVKIEYCFFETADEMDLAERYYIPKIKPKYNTSMINREINFSLQELDEKQWSEYKYEIDNSRGKKKVIELFSERIFDSVTDTAIFYNNYDYYKNRNSIISAICNGRKRNMIIDGQVLCFMFYEEYLTSSDVEIELKKYHALHKPEKVHKEKYPSEIVCIETKERFKGEEEVLKRYPLISRTRLKLHLKNKKDFCWIDFKCDKQVRFVYRGTYERMLYEGEIEEEYL